MGVDVGLIDGAPVGSEVFFFVGLSAERRRTTKENRMNIIEKISSARCN